MAFVAIYTVGRLKYPNNHPASRDFFKVGAEVFRQATRSGHLIEAFSSDGIVLPQGVMKEDGVPILTLTVWQNLESLYRFTYTGQHLQALRDRSKWMENYREKHLSYVLWWTEKPNDVSLKEAFKRYDYYVKNGPTPYAFDFKNVFDEKGTITS